MSIDASLTPGLEIEEYIVSDAEGIEMKAVPEFPSGTYYIKWNTSLPIYDKNYNLVTGLTMPENWTDLYGWQQKTLKSHLDFMEYHYDYRKQFNPSEYHMSYEEYVYFFSGIDKEVLIDQAVNEMATKKYIDWSGRLINFTGRVSMITDVIQTPNVQYSPKINYESGNNRFKCEYQPGKGGWMFLLSPFFRTSDKFYTVLYQIGGYTKEEPKELNGFVYVHVRTVDDKRPNGDWSSVETVEKKVVYYNGRKTVSGTKSIADIAGSTTWKNGYRVVGNNVRIQGMDASTAPAKYSNQKNGGTANYTIEFPYDKTVAVITFFVEEAKTDVKYCYRTNENQVPYGNFKDMYTHSTLVAWNDGTLNQKTQVIADMDGLIWPNAYRYIGYAISENESGKVAVAKYPTSTDPSLVVNIDEDFQKYYRKEIIVTFFLEPAELTVKYCYRTSENDVPNSYENYRYKEMYDDYKPNPVKAWTGGVKNQTVTITPDMELIYGTGYRYLGYSITRDKKGESKPANYPEGLKAGASPAVHTDDFDSSKTSTTGIDEAEITITFFVDEAEGKIVYCYRTPKNEVPTNGAHQIYQEFYYDFEPNPIISWLDDKNLVYEIKKEADLDLVDSTGYRYLGYKIARNEMGTMQPAPYGPDLKPEILAEWRENFDCDKAKDWQSCIQNPEIVITFFIEPVIGYYGQLWRDEDGNITKDQAFRYIEGSEYQNRAGIKFPDFYDPVTKSCFKPISTFNKFFFPGEILIGAEVMEYKYIDPLKMDSDAAMYNPWTGEYSRDKNIWQKEYDESTTTMWGDQNRLLLKENFYSSYSDTEKIPGIVQKNTETKGFAKDKQFWFIYNTPETEIIHERITGDAMLDLHGNPIRGIIQILNEFAYLESLCTDNVGLPKTIGIGDAIFTYSAVGYDLQEVEIFEKTSSGYKSSAKITKDNYQSYRGVFEKSFIEQYINLQGTFGMQLLNANKNWRIVFRYEYNPELVKTKLVIKYKLNSPNGEDLQEPTIVDIPSGDNYKVTVPTEIKGCVPEYYIKNSNPDERKDFDNIIIQGDPTIGTQTIVIVYVPKNIEIPVINNGDKIVLRANINNDEEYDIEKAIPTSEDVYVSGDAYSYRFEDNIVKRDEKKKVTVTVVQEYYKDSVNKTRDNVSTVSTTPFEVQLDYQYYDVLKAELYDLEEMLLENEAIKYYEDYNRENGDYKKYEEGKATFAVNKKNPYIDYYEPSETERIIVRANPADGLLGSNDNFTVVLPTVADVKPEVEELNKMFNSNNPGYALDVLRRNTEVSLTKLILKEDDKHDVVILTGNKYYLNKMYEAMKDGVNYIPFELERAPIYSFLKDQGLFVQEQAENKVYNSTFTSTYLKAAEVLNHKAENYKTSIRDALIKLPTTINSISVHTPIVNDVQLIVDAKLNQLVPGKTTISNVVVLDEGIDIVIKNLINFNAEKGYGNKDYNYNGLLKDDDNGNKKNALLISKSNGSVPMKKEDYADEDEEKSLGPSFAEYKLIRFPYEVYLVSGESNENKNETEANLPILFKANEWYNLYEYLPARTEKYHFMLPVWVEDEKAYTGTDGIQVLVIAENCNETARLNAMNNPMSISNAKKNDNKNQYILRTSFDTYVAGRIYDLQVRDSDDPGFMNKLKQAIGGKPAEKAPDELPIAQKGQISAYNIGMKLGYTIFFDMKTKGIANQDISIKPKVYYVSSDGNTVTDDISIFYHAVGNMYRKLDENDLPINMNMSMTHGNVNNPGFTNETIVAKKINPSAVYTKVENIGQMLLGLKLDANKQKLPYNNILECAKAYGFDNNVQKFVNSTLVGQMNGNTDKIMNSTGHWYGEFRLPATSQVFLGEVTRDEAIKSMKKPLTNGYIVVTFEGLDTNNSNYLTYSAPSINTQWQKEGIDPTIILPNGSEAKMPVDNAAPMVIYQVGLRANNDFEQVGTH